MIAIQDTWGAGLRVRDGRPLGFAAGDQNLYRFVGNNPTNFVDPSGLSPVGHHWVPVSVLTDPEIRKKLTSAAYEVAMGAYSGPTTPSHRYWTYGGVSHAQYNNIIRENLLKYMEKHNLSRMGQEHMWDFIEKIKNGQNFEGEPDRQIKSFNDAIKRQREAYVKVNPKKRGFRFEQTMERCRGQGQSYLKGPGFNSLAVGAILATWASGALSEAQGALAVAADSQHFRNGIRALSEGNLALADREFFGPGDARGSYSFYADLVDKGLHKPAAWFEIEYYKALEEARNRLRR